MMRFHRVTYYSCVGSLLVSPEHQIKVYPGFKQASVMTWPLGGASRLSKSCWSHWLQHCFVLATAQIINQ